VAASFGTVRNVADYGLTVDGTPSANAALLQAAIDTWDGIGCMLLVDRCYPCDPITLKKNVSLGSMQGPRFAGPYPAAGGTSGLPGGGGFIVTDTTDPFISLVGTNSVMNLTFYYSGQTYSATTIGGTITYPPTIANGQAVLWDCNISGNCFVGPTTCIDLNYVTATEVANLIIDANYGYPAGGYFLRLNMVLDIPRITRNHVNPGTGSRFQTRDVNNLIWTTALIADVVNNGAATYDLTMCDEFMAAYNFAYGVKTAFKITDCYGSMFSCEVDQSDTGIQFTPNTARQYKVLHVHGFTYIPYSATSGAARNGIIFDGVGGFLKIHGMHGILSTATANALIKVSGTGSQICDIASATKYAISGTWTNHVETTNGSATVTTYT
jgi:hypothetical protein